MNQDTLSRLPLTRMASFALVAKHKSFTGAAEVLGVPRSTVSQQISALEAELGVKLLFRSTRKVTLSAAGELYVEHCNRMLQSAYEANQALSEWREQPTGRLRITAPEGSGTTIHGKLITQFQARFPSVEIEMLISDETLDVIDTGIDVAFRTGKLQDSNLICKKLASIERVVVANQSYAKQFGLPDLNALSQHSCIVHTPLRKWPVLHEKGVQHIEVSTGLISNSLLFIREACLHGRGLALLPKFMCEDFIQAGLLVTVSALKIPDNAYYMIYQSRKQQTKALQCFLEFASNATLF